METKGYTLEEIDAIFETKHSTVPDLEEVYKGKAQIDVEATEKATDDVIKAHVDGVTVNEI